MVYFLSPDLKHMPSRPYVFLPDHVYHLYTRWYEKQSLFLSDRDFKRMMQTIQRYGEEFDNVFTVYAYCLLPNHLHMMVRVLDADRFAATRSRILQAYAMYFKKKYQTPKGQPVYESRFKAKNIGTDEYLYQCHSYIAHNAVHHGLVDDTADRPRTSYHDDPVDCDGSIDMSDWEF